MKFGEYVGMKSDLSDASGASKLHKTRFLFYCIVSLYFARKQNVRILPAQVGNACHVLPHDPISFNASFVANGNDDYAN